MNITTRTMLLAGFILLLGQRFSLADDWSQWRGDNRDGVWKETGVLTKFSPGQLKPSWRQPVNSGYSSPTVVAGKVFVFDYDAPNNLESVRCFNAQSGEPIWRHEYPCEYRISYTAGPRSAITVDGSRAYSLGAMGNLHCFNVDDGEVVWESDLNERYKISELKRMPIWGIATSPLVYKDLLILQIGAKDATVVALDKNTGKQVWRSLDDRGQYSSPVLVQQNGNDVVLCWTGDSVVGLNPSDGSVYWNQPFFPTRMPIGVATPVVNGNKIFLTSFYDGAMMLEMSDTEMTIEKMWHQIGDDERKTKAIHSIISTPIWIDDYIYGMDSYGQLRCINASDGSRVWEDLSAVNRKRWGTIHFVRNGQNIWMLNEQGELMVGNLSPDGLKINGRQKVIEPNQMRTPNRKNGVIWSHPAFADKSIFVRSDSELIRIDLTQPESE